MEMERWGTWEELLLGGAILRHGTRDWDVVSSELRARSVCPFNFTPEVCKAKYEDLRQRYSGCTAWFDEVRKRRMEELRQALEVSESSIGSLESKLQILKAERKDECNVGYSSSQTESVVRFQKSDESESSCKELMKDGLSAGSFTQETRTNWSPEHYNLASVSAEEVETKPEVLILPKLEKISGIGKLAEILCGGQGVCVKRRRGKRKRKDCIKDIKEGSVGESEFLVSSYVPLAARCKENSTSSSGQNTRCVGVDDQSRVSGQDGNADLTEICDSLAENKCATLFRRKRDSQKRGRYKQMILRHMDFDTIRSRIASCSITSTKELFRDLLLLANNAMVFYSKTTREYKSAALLREIVTKSLKQHLNNYISRSTIALLSMMSPLPVSTPVKPRSARPGKHKLSARVAKRENVGPKSANTNKKPSSVHSPPLDDSLAIEKSSLTTKKCGGRTRKPGHGSANERSENPMKGRKRNRVK